MRIVKKIVNVGLIFLIILMIFAISRSSPVSAQVCSGTASPTYTSCTCRDLISGGEECDCLTTSDPGSCYWRDGVCLRCAQANDICELFSPGPTCEIHGGSPGSCTTSGCTVTSPEPTPPSPPLCPEVCCPADTCDGYLNNSDGDTACGSDLICCTNCIDPDPTPPTFPPPKRPVSFKIWYFWDKDRSGSWTSGDAYLPSNVLASSKFKLHVNTDVNNIYDYVYTNNSAQSSSWRSINIIGGGDTHTDCSSCDPDSPDWDGDWGACCTREWVVADCAHDQSCPGYDNCLDDLNYTGWTHVACGYYSSSYTESGHTAPCDVQAQCGDGSAGGALLTFDDTNLKEKLKTNLFWNSEELWDMPYGEGTFGDTLSIGPQENLNYWSTGADFELELPEDWEVTVTRIGYKNSESSTSTEIYTDSRIKTYGYLAYAVEYTAARLFVVGLSEKKEPPMVVSYSNDTNDQICSAGEGGASVTFSTTYSDPDDPSIDNHMVNGDFESGSNSWSLWDQSGGSYNFFPADTYNDYGAVEMSIGTSGDRMMSVYQGRDAGQNDYTDDPSQWAGKTIYFSFYYKLSADAQINLQVSPKTFAGIDTWWSPEGILTLSSPINEWTRAEKAVTFPEQIGGLDILGFDVSLLATNSNPSDPVTVWVDDVTITDTQEQVFTDIHDFQFNLETEDDSSFSQTLWPLRVFFNRKDSYRNLPANSFAVDSGTNIGDSIGEYATAIYDEPDNIWYLPTDLPLRYNDESGDIIATLKGGTEGAAYNTWFTSNGYNVNANWTVEFNSNFPVNTYNANLYVRDMNGLQDSIAPTGAGESMLTLNGPYYFHRLGTLGFIEPTLDINFVEYEDEDPGINDYCFYESGHASVSLEDATLEITDSNNLNPQTVPVVGVASSIEVDCATCDTAYNVTLDIPEDSGYVCGCRAVSGDPSTCFYANVPASYIDGNDEINFYLKSVDLTNEAWFQTVGGSIQAVGQIISFVPYDDATPGPCLTTVDCYPSLIAGAPFSGGNGTNSPGFAITANSRIDTHSNPSDLNQHSLIHYNTDRSQAVDGNAPSVTLSTTQENYNYFYSKFGAEYDIPANTLTDATMPDDFSTDALEVRFYKENVTIDQDNLWAIAANQKVVVFVGDGTTDYDLTIEGDDSIIIEVAEGGFLAFIVSGNITVDEAVGHDMDGLGYDEANFIPNTPNTNSIEGVFIADGTLTIASDGLTTTRDRKFIGAGTFVGWTDINLNRNFHDNDLGMALHNVQATETFIHRPDFLLNMPDEMKVATHEWRQVPAAIE